MTKNEMEPNYLAYFDMPYLERAGLIDQLDGWTEMCRDMSNNSEDKGEL